MFRTVATPLLVAILIATLPAAAAEVAGVAFPDAETVAPDAPPLALNGAGVRRRAFFQIYAIGLYLPRKTASGLETIAGPGPKRIRIHVLRDVTADQFADAISEGVRNNQSEAQMKALEPRLAQLNATIARTRAAKKDTRITLDDVGGFTRIGVDGAAAGAPIAGEDFYRALLSIWIGEKPVQEDLKRALLGGAR